ncbi:GNAT family N-acetyltransferase [Jeotgalibacillus proteolyticus]|uniref:GNAT family N-acetyltransferase n=1 Tax=Jeotgalibacillus proteolyticus TaxID=2082395 RepID=UPI003CEBA7C0
MHLFQGELTHQPTDTVQQFTVRQLDQEDEGLFFELQNKISEGLENPDMLQPLTKNELLYILSEGGIMLGAFVNDHLIGARALLYPGEDSENIGHDLELPYYERMKVVHQEISLVHTDYRGNHLQQTLAKVLMQQLKYTNDFFTHLCCTVSPLNVPSIKDKFSQGLMIVQMKEKYEGISRYIFYKHLVNDFPVDTSSYIYIRLDKTSRHRDFLQKGYVGIWLDQTELGDWIVFARLKEKN